MRGRGCNWVLRLTQKIFIVLILNSLLSRPLKIHFSEKLTQYNFSLIILNNRKILDNNAYNAEVLTF